MDHEDERVEALLRQFRPRAPHPFPLAEDAPGVGQWIDEHSAKRAGGWIGVVVAATVAIIAANVRLMPGVAPSPLVPAATTLLDAQGLVEGDPAAFDDALFDASRQVLPDVEARDSVLRLLARP